MSEWVRDIFAGPFVHAVIHPFTHSIIHSLTMYTPKLFANENTRELIGFMREHPFAMLVTQHEGRPFASHLPFDIVEKTADSGRFYLQAHLARANPQWRSFAENEEVLVVFTGPHSYVSSSWYAEMNVSTWNYVAVHAYGKLRILDDGELRDALARLTRRYESGMEKPLFMEAMPDDYITRQLRGIVGFEVEITALEGKWKLSQNRSDADFRRIVGELEKSEHADSQAVAAMMTGMRHEA